MNGAQGGASAACATGPIPVCVITAAYPAPAEPTRAIFIENLCRELAALRASGGGERFRLAVVAPRIARTDPLRESRAGLEVRRFRYPSGGRRLKEHRRMPCVALAAYIAAGLLAALAEVRRIGAKVIHGHWVLPAGLIGALASALTRVPLVIHAHGSDIHRYGRGSRLARNLVRRVLARSARVLAVSGELCRLLEDEFGARQARLSVLPMGIDGGIFGPGDRAAARRVLGLSDGPADLLFAGDLAEEKGALGLCRALLSDPAGGRPARLNLAGDGPDRPSIEALGREAPERVRWLGRLPPRELSLWYRAADLLVLPSRSEGAPVSIQEALASGLPVAATAVGGVPELVRSGKEGWLAPAGASPEEFLQVVRKALEAPGEIARIRAELLKGGEDRTARRRAVELGRILEEVVHGRAGEGA